VVCHNADAKLAGPIVHEPVSKREHRASGKRECSMVCIMSLHFVREAYLRNRRKRCFLVFGGTTPLANPVRHPIKRPAVKHARRAKALSSKETSHPTAAICSGIASASSFLKKSARSRLRVISFSGEPAIIWLNAGKETGLKRLMAD